MAKIYGLFGSMQGKVADVVMAVRNGEQIVRKYQPIVSNPSSSAQVGSRAKLKLLSQMSAVFAPVIAIPREGTVSPRNRFTQLNYKTVTYASNQADIALTSVKITKSVVSITPLNASRNAGNVTVGLSGTNNNWDRVVYAAFAKQSDNTLRFVNSSVVTEPGADSLYQATISVGTTSPIVVYAYGVRLNSDAARASFGDLTVESAETVAKLVVTRLAIGADITLSETKAIELAEQN